MPVKLLYFNARGVIEVARYILHIGGEDWEDYRYSIELPNYKKEEADAAKVKDGRGMRKIEGREDRLERVREIERERERERERPQHSLARTCAHSARTPLRIYTHSGCWQA
jgi:hypothetical protein